MSDANIWQAGTTDVPVVNADGNIFEETQVAAGGETIFTLATFTYTPNTHSIFVWKNGSMLRRGVDYTETAEDTITAAVAAVALDKFTFVAFAIQQIIPPIVFNGLPPGGTSGQNLTKTSASDYEATWSDPEVAVTLLDAARSNIASATTVNLVAIQDTTRNIQITGSTQIDGFQISNGQLWAVKFAASLVLKNNASIITQSGQDIAVGPNDTCFLRAIADNIVEILAYSKAQSTFVRNHHDFRLSLTTGVPVTSADVIAGTSIYMVPYSGNKISLYNGTAWVVRESAEISIPLAGLTLNIPYDVFVYDNLGVPTLEYLAWTSVSARATDLTKQDGVYVKMGAATRKYVGTFQALSATTTTDSQRQRLLWNYYNRVLRRMWRQETAASWAYGPAIIRQANANVLNQLEYVCGVQEDDISFEVHSLVQHSNAGAAMTVGIGVNSTVAFAANSASITGIAAAANAYSHTRAYLNSYANLGFNFYAWLEHCPAAAAVATFQGTTNSYLAGSVKA